MSVTVDWFNEEKTIIKYQFEGQWKWEELYIALQQVDVMMNSVQHTVYIIVDYQKSSGVPAGALTHLRSSTMKAAPNWGGGVFIGISSLVQALLNVFTSLNKKLGERYATAKNMETAYSIIQGWQMNEHLRSE